MPPALIEVVTRCRPHAVGNAITGGVRRSSERPGPSEAVAGSPGSLLSRWQSRSSSTMANCLRACDSVGRPVKPEKRTMCPALPIRSRSPVRGSAQAGRGDRERAQPNIRGAPLLRPLGRQEADRALPPGAPRRPAELFALLAEGGLTAPIDSTYPLPNAGAALRRAENGGISGKIILTPEARPPQPNGQPLSIDHHSTGSRNELSVEAEAGHGIAAAKLVAELGGIGAAGWQARGHRPQAGALRDQAGLHAVR